MAFWSFFAKLFLFYYQHKIISEHKIVSVISEHKIIFFLCNYNSEQGKYVKGHFGLFFNILITLFFHATVQNLSFYISFIAHGSNRNHID